MKGEPTGTDPYTGLRNFWLARVSVLVMPKLLALLCACAALPFAAPAVALAADNPLPPTVSTDAPAAVTLNGATLKASVDPNGAATTYHFEYGTSDSYGLATSDKSAGDGDSAVSVEVPVSGLTSDTTYHLRIVATNAAGVSRSTDRAFKTFAAGRAPGVSSASTRDVRQDSATLRATLDPRGLVTTHYFEWGTSTKYGARTPDQTVDGGGLRTVTAPITTLKPYTTYYYRLVATNPVGTTRGGNRSFRTLRAPTGVELAISGNPALWGGTVNLSGRVLGSGIGGTTVAIERSDFPYTRATWVPRTAVAAGDGSFRVDIGPLWQTTRLRAVTRTTIAAASPWIEVGSRPRVGLRRAGSTGEAVVLTGAISPALPSARVSVQRQTLAGRWVPVVRGGVAPIGNRSRYRLTVPKVRRASLIRVAVIPFDSGGHTLGYSRELRLRGATR